MPDFALTDRDGKPLGFYDAVVGGRYLATATIEYVHWLNERWGAAVFTDVGDASDSIRTWEALKSYGVGARFRTPAGPFAALEQARRRGAGAITLLGDIFHFFIAHPKFETPAIRGRYGTAPVAAHMVFNAIGLVLIFSGVGG